MSDKTYIVISVYWNEVLTSTMTKNQIKEYQENEPDTQIAIIDGDLKKSFREHIDIDELE